MTKFTIWMISGLLLAACGKSDFQGISKKNSPSKSPEIESSICYTLNEGNDHSCFQLVESKNLTTPGHYDYADPFSEENFPGQFDPNQYRAPQRYLDLQAIPSEKPIAKNFVVGELMQDWKGQYGLFSNLAMLQIQALRNEVNTPVIVNSGYRSPGYNSTLSGAAKWSRHMYGDAIDFKVNGKSFSEISDLCIKHGASFFQIYANHIHCDWRNLPLNSEFYPGPTINPGFINLKETIEKQSKIIAVAEKNFWLLSVKTDFIEDQPELVTYTWQIYDRHGQVHIFTAPEVELPKLLGPYQIEVTIGGSIELKTTLTNN